MAEIDTLRGLVLPESLGLLRDHVVAARYRPEGYDARYDFRTLAYDAVFLPRAGKLRIFCPKLANFERLFAKADLRLDGAPVRRVRIRREERFDSVEISAPSGAAELTISLGDWKGRLAVSRADPAPFAGTNCLLTLSRNNDLVWIRDWAEFHVREQGADAVLFFDNGSTLYTPAEIDAALRSVRGLARVQVVRADFPFGPAGIKPRRFDANFLQRALLNLAPLRYLAEARAVLVCDVDELIWRGGETSIFDATVASRGGYLRMPGSWRFPRGNGTGAVRHADHVLIDPERSPCPPKYCVAPRGRLRGHVWATHRVAGLFWQRRHTTTSFGFLHCQGISDFWKGRPMETVSRPLRADPLAERVLARSLGREMSGHAPLVPAS